MKIYLIWTAFIIIVSMVNESDCLTCMFGKTEALAGRECPSNSNGTYECATGKLTILGLSTKLGLGCYKDCKEEEVVSLDKIPGVKDLNLNLAGSFSVELDCCRENFCNRSFSIMQNVDQKKMALLFLAFVISAIFQL